MYWAQKSFKGNRKDGSLYLVPTPIGNLEDMSFRAIKTLQEVNLIAAEDTRKTQKLLNHFSVDTKLISYHEHNKFKRDKELINKLKEGLNIALVSDAGMPIISDPGYELVQAAISEKITVIPLPGPNAALTALIASGLQPHPFYFYGFLPRKRSERIKELHNLQQITATLIFYESPYRLKETLEAILTTLGDRNIVLSRELTKLYEEFIRGKVSEVMDWVNETELRGEFCIVIEKQTNFVDDREQWWEEYSIIEHVNYYIDTKKLSVRDAIKLTAETRNLNRREVYQKFHSRR